MHPRLRGSNGNGENLPNPRDISNGVFNGGWSPPESKVHTHMLPYFSVFVNNDVVSTPNIQLGKKWFDMISLYEI